MQCKMYLLALWVCHALCRRLHVVKDNYFPASKVRRDSREQVYK